MLRVYYQDDSTKEEIRRRGGDITDTCGFIQVNVPQDDNIDYDNLKGLESFVYGNDFIVVAEKEDDIPAAHELLETFDWDGSVGDAVEEIKEEYGIFAGEEITAFFHVAL